MPKKSILPYFQLLYATTEYAQLSQKFHFDPSTPPILTIYIAQVRSKPDIHPSNFRTSEHPILHRVTNRSFPRSSDFPSCHSRWVMRRVALCGGTLVHLCHQVIFILLLSKLTSEACNLNMPVSKATSHPRYAILPTMTASNLQAILHTSTPTSSSPIIRHHSPPCQPRMRL